MEPVKKPRNKYFPRGGKDLSTEERFWPKVLKSDSCWEWQASLTDKGYGQFFDKGVRILAHRYSYKLRFGKIPEGLFLCHTCDNPKCVNPDHLKPGTQKDNIQDMIAKGRRFCRNKNKTHCIRGHEFSGHNLIIKAKQRLCRICNNESNRLAAQRHRAKLKEMETKKSL